jgi:exodeoxyribonuclease VII large subunit
VTEPLVLTPTDFVAITNQLLETSFGHLYLQGEISSFRISKQKWVYFDLKDEFSKVACFASVYALPGPLQDGMVVRIGGNPRLHHQFGFSVTVQTISSIGEGSLHQALILLKNKLQQEGLFDTARKRTLPQIPLNLALVASVESAAYADFIKVASARWPFLQVTVYDSLVQGEQAPQSLVSAINAANAQATLPQVLVITRGGGSADDLAAFNDERVVRAIAASRIPTMVAIGHEIDESLSELAADSRASTPSNAAELLLPDKIAELQDIGAYKKHLANSAKAIAALELSNLSLLKQRLAKNFSSLLNSEKQDLGHYNQLLKSYNPNNVLNRGYTMVKSGGQVITSKQKAAKHTKFDIIFKDGNIKVTKD